MKKNPNLGISISFELLPLNDESNDTTEPVKTPPRPPVSPKSSPSEYVNPKYKERRKSCLKS